LAEWILEKQDTRKKQRNILFHNDKRIVIANY